MLTEAVQDGGQAMRDPVGGSVEFHFVPILKLISTLLIMGVFENEDVKHILKMIEPTVFSGEAEAAAEEAEATAKGAGSQTLALKEGGEEVKEEEEGAVESGHETEMEDEGMGEEDEELEAELEEPVEKEEEEEEEEEDGEKVDGEKGAEETEKEATPGEADGEAEEQVGLEEGLLHMKLPESVKLQVGVCVSLITSL